MSKDASSTLPSDVSSLQLLLLAERKKSQQRVTDLQTKLTSSEAELAQAKSQLATKDLELQIQPEAHQQKQSQLERRSPSS